MNKYSLDFINNLKNNSYKLIPVTVLEKIDEINVIVNSPKYNKMSYFNYKNKNYNLDNSSLILNKTILKKNEGIDKEINVMRNYLNKLTETNFNLILPSIKSKFNYVIDIYNKDECYQFIQSFFNILLNNLLFSYLYANILKELYFNDYIQNIIDENFNNFLETFKNIKNNEPSSDLSFDELSIVNKEFDKNKAIALLFVNLLKVEIIKKDKIMHLINEITSIFFELIDMPNQKFNTEELSEIIYILIKNSFNLLKIENGYELIENNINYISNIKIHSRKSISNKIIFKFMNLKDEIKI